MNRFRSKSSLQFYLYTLTLLALTMTVILFSCSEKPMKQELILIEDGDYMYLAKVLNGYSESDTQIQVYIFNDKIREKIGDSIPNSKLAAKRTKPENGWGTRQLALQYYWNEEWIYSENVTEFEDYFLIPVEEDKDREIKLRHIRFLIPVQR